MKDSVPRELRSRVIYKFTCCNACYIGETVRHLSTRIREHLSSDKSSHIFKHLQSSERCRQSCSEDCFAILDSAPSKFQLKLKEAMHINWEKPNFKSTSSSHQSDIYTDSLRRRANAGNVSFRISLRWLIHIN